MKKWRLIISIILIIISLAVFSFYYYINNKLDKIEYVALPNDNIELSIDESIAEDEVKKEIKNILVLGSDSRDGDLSGSRTDAIMIVTIDPNTGSIKLTSIMRDSYLYDPIRERYDKINHAYAYNGELGTLKSINKTLDLNIDDFIIIDFSITRDIVDLVGGIEIEVDSSEVKYINGYIKELNRVLEANSEYINTPGTMTLDGIQAVAYARIRYTEGGDEKRTERQREILSATFEKAKNIDVMGLLGKVDEIIPKVTTSISKGEIIGLAKDFIKFKNSTIEQYVFPKEAKGIKLDGVYYHIPVTLEENIVDLHEFIFGDTDYEVSDDVKSYSDYIIEKTGYKPLSE